MWSWSVEPLKPASGCSSPDLPRRMRGTLGNFVGEGLHVPLDVSVGLRHARPGWDVAGAQPQLRLGKSGASVDAAVGMRSQIEPNRNLTDGHGRHGGFNRPSQNYCRATQKMKFADGRMMDQPFDGSQRHGCVREPCSIRRRAGLQ